MTVIASLSNPKIKEAVKLRDGKHRRRSGKFLIDGHREIQRAVQAGIHILKVFTVLPFAAPANTAVYQVAETVMQKLVFGDRNEGMVALAEEPVRTLEIFEKKVCTESADSHFPIIAVLEKIEKPGNLGAVFRSADGAGIDGILIADSLVDPFHSNAIRSSMGTVFSIPMASESSENIYRWLRRNNFHIAAARCSGETVLYTDIDFCRPTAIVLGNEAEGVTDTWNGSGMTSVMIPMMGIADSLNVSIAAGILFYEAIRNRRK